MNNYEFKNNEIILEDFIAEIISFLKKNEIPVTPLNIFLNYEKILEEQNKQNKEILKSYIVVENNKNNSNLAIESEKNFNNGFEHIKKILKTTSTLYQNIQFMKKNSINNYEIINKSQNIVEIKDTLRNFNIEMNKFSNLMENKLIDIKKYYESSIVVLNEVKNKSIYDNYYEIFNKNYLTLKLNEEIINIEKFNYKSSLMAIQINKIMEKKINNEKIIKILNKNLIRLIIKTSRRSDIITYYQNGIFLILLQQTDMEHSKQAGERIKELIENSNFFFDNLEINIKISISLINIKTEDSNNIIKTVLDGLENSHIENKIIVFD